MKRLLFIIGFGVVIHGADASALENQPSCPLLSQPTAAPTRMHQMRARRYSSYQHRFRNGDPSGFGGGESYYAYTGDNSLALVGPTGLNPNLVFRHFTKSHLRIFLYAYNEAFRFVRHAYGFLSRLTVSGANRNSTYLRWFGHATRGRLETIAGKYKLILQLMKRGEIYITAYDFDVDGSSYYITPGDNNPGEAIGDGGRSNIDLYSDFWIQGDESWEATKAHVILHEMAHNAWERVSGWTAKGTIHNAYDLAQYISDGPDFIGGGIYGVQQSELLAIDNPNLAVLHADSYALFARDLMGDIRPDEWEW